MANLINIEFTKTYATRANAEKAVAKLKGTDGLRYMIVPVEMPASDKIRYGVLFIGERAFSEGMHFHFNVIF